MQHQLQATIFPQPLTTQTLIKRLNDWMTCYPNVLRENSPEAVGSENGIMLHPTEEVVPTVPRM
jgi:hypothetical protein